MDECMESPGGGGDGKVQEDREFLMRCTKFILIAIMLWGYRAAFLGKRWFLFIL